MEITGVSGSVLRGNQQIEEKTTQLEALKRRDVHITAASIEAQANVDPLPLLEKLLDDESSASALRATLKRLIKRFEFVSRDGRFVRTFEIDFMPGVYLAELSNTPAIDMSTVCFQVTVTTSAVRPAVWTVQGHRLPGHQH